MSYLNIDYDISCMIGEYHNQRKKYTNVIQELQELIDFNIHIKYIKSFQFYKHRYPRTFSRDKLIKIVNSIYKNNSKTTLLHDWPTKPPNFGNPEEYRHTYGDTYIPRDPDMKGWKCKAYPPNKGLYTLRSIKYYKLLRGVEII